ncbi:MAG: hypothetical protein ACI9OJ_001374, partial [Myxococcota bacterium]
MLRSPTLPFWYDRQRMFAPTFRLAAPAIVGGMLTGLLIMSGCGGEDSSEPDGGEIPTDIDFPVFDAQDVAVD